MATFDRRATRRTRAKHESEKKPTIEQKLLAGMERLLAQGQRFGALTIEQLSEEAGISRATFYTHFRDKADLVSRLMKHVTEELAQSTGTWLANAGQAKVRDVRDAAIGLVNQYKKHQAILAAINDTSHDETVTMLFDKMVDDLARQARDSLRAVKKRGDSRSGASDDVAEVLTWMVALYCVRFVSKREGNDLAKLARTMGYISASVVFSDTEKN